MNKSQLFAGIAIGSCLLISGCFKDVVAACDVSNVTVSPDFFIINGEADAGFVVSVLTEKTNRDGEVTLEVNLSSTEGDVTKERKVYMKKGQRNNILFQFHEPTINAQQVTALARCWTI